MQQRPDQGRVFSPIVGERRRLAGAWGQVGLNHQSKAWRNRRRVCCSAVCLSYRGFERGMHPRMAISFADSPALPLYSMVETDPKDLTLLRCNATCQHGNKDHGNENKDYL